MPKCPDCKSPGEQHPWIGTERKPDGSLGTCYGSALCYTCGGTNEVSEEKLVHMALGRRLRQLRVDSRVSLRERAAELGVKSSTLSYVEAGRISSENRVLAEQLWATLPQEGDQP